MRRSRRGVKRGGAAVDCARTLRYAARVTQRPRVTLPDRAADQPRALPLAAIAVVALGAGVASAYGLERAFGHAREPGDGNAALDTDANTEADEQSSTARSVAADETPRAEAKVVAAERDAGSQPGREQAALAANDMTAAETQLPSSDAAPAPQLEAAKATQPAASAAAAPAASAAAAPSSRIDEKARAGFTRGRVAYLRCDGLPQRKGPIPCPRDRALEQRVWSVLEALERCPKLASERGAGEVRLDIANGKTDLHVSDAELDSTAVGSCAGTGLRSIRTALRPTRMIVSFRFELR